MSVYFIFKASESAKALKFVKSCNFFKLATSGKFSEFSSVRKRSSIIVQNKETHKYYIFCKGSINTIKQLVNTEDKINIDNNDQIILNNYPELRVMACAYKELDKDQKSHQNSLGSMNKIVKI